MAVLPSINRLLNKAMKSKSIIRADGDSTRVYEGVLEIWTVLISVRKREGKRKGVGDAHARHHAYGCYSWTRWNQGSDIVEVASTCAPSLPSQQFMIKVPWLCFWWTCKSERDGTKVFDTVWQVHPQTGSKQIHELQNCRIILRGLQKHRIDFLFITSLLSISLIEIAEILVL